MLERLPFWGQVLLMVALAAGLVGIAYYLFPNLKQQGEEIVSINKELEDLKKQYKKGGLGDVVLKKRLAHLINEQFTPIRERREELSRHPKHVMDILEAGTRAARASAKETLAEVRTRMKIDYFG